eukprot:GAHX01008685.1.p1 GENE.GAHX01008685.1~~GAHX01008685.1.p1  ORF type:complete len:52 (-),score=0.94 GAHX01008685.1:203-358(-)
MHVYSMFFDNLLYNFLLYFIRNATGIIQMFNGTQRLIVDKTTSLVVKLCSQ